MFTPAQKPRGLARMIRIDIGSRDSIGSGDSVPCMSPRVTSYRTILPSLHSAPTGELTHVADIRPFAAIKYVPSPKLNVSEVIAPPYDVLNEQQKAALQARHPNNIVTVDLPFMPPKSVGPDEVYARAN